MRRELFAVGNFEINKISEPIEVLVSFALNFASFAVKKVSTQRAQSLRRKER